jgi:pimeloyl-ACP methyl ester carboxylesterase
VVELYCALFWPKLATASPLFPFQAWADLTGAKHYSIECFIEEIFASIEVAGLAASGRAPILAAHSFGGSPAFMAAMARPDEVGGLILLDSGIDIPGEEWKGPPKRTAPNRVYPTLEMALARFRLAPPQPCENHWALDHIARTSLKEVEGGWTWQFDPFLWNGFSPPVLSQVAPDLPVPAFVVRGAHSYLADDRLFDYMKSILPKGTGFVTVPEAQHHLLLDQPLATIATLEACLAGFAILRNRAMRG